MGKSFKLSLSVLLVISVLWKPAYSDKCSLSCKGSPTAPSYLNGHSYNYGVEGTVSIFLTGADRQETSVKLLGQVSVIGVGNCVNELKVQNLVISGPDGKKYSSPPGIDKPIRFALSNGALGAEICAEEGDTRRSLNIKRALISLLQTENKASTQTDVFGVCPTEASSSQEGSAALLHRSRDLSRCAYREQGKHDLITGIVNPNAEIKNTQVLQSTLHVESKVNNGVSEKVSASEEYLYRPFSVGENGARAKVHTKLTLTGKAAGAPTGVKCTETRTVIFENPHGAPSGGNAEAALAAIKDTAKTLGSEASSKSAGEFAQLVRILRTVNKEELTKVYQQIKGNSLEKRVFLDGVLRAGTGYSIEASIEILKSHELSALEQQLVLLSLGNAKHVHNEALKAAAGLLDMPNAPKQLYLGVGALAGSYCRDHNCHTTKSDGIAALTQKLASKLQNCKPKSKVEEDNVVAVLKGIRNIHHLEDSVIDKLVRCANDNNVKPRVRVAAIEAFGADPCATKVHKLAMDLMKNRQLDSEIRIQAYLAVIKCPCAHSATEIKNLLESEPVHQVGRFISSSLRAIRSSANPDRRLQREHYGAIRTPNKFNIDDRKYSFYRELSYNVDALGVGGNLEQTVIYSQDSFLPRSASLNVTAELFGHSLNVLEVGGRQGNLDRVAEHFLGPKSFLRTEKPQDIYDNIVKKIREMDQKVEGSLSRGRRSVKSEVDNFDKHLKAESVPYNNELDLDVYLKLFGTDAIFLSLGDDKGFDFNHMLDQLLKTANEGVEKLKHFQQEVRAHLLFLDAELAYPTSTGFPIKLDLVGSATGRLDVATNIDLRQIYRNPKNAKLDIKLVPSTDVEIAGLFLVDADAVSTGLKVITNLHSSTGSHIVAKVLEDGHGIDLQFGLPIDKQEIVTASNDLVYFTAEKGRKEKHNPIKVDTDRKEYSGCFDQLSEVLGLTLCGEVSVPFSVSGPEAQASISKFLARYPLTGSGKVKLVLEKNDLKGYHIKGILRNDNPEKQGFEILLEAEGSKNRRTSVSGDLIRTNQEKTIKLSVESPIKTLSGEISFINKQNEMIGLVKAKLDAIEYYAKAGFTIQGNDRRSVFKPIIEYQIDEQGKHNLKVDGQVIRENNPPTVKYTLEGIKITIPNSNEIVDVNGHFTQTAGRNVDIDVKAKKGEHNMVISGSVKGHDAKLEFQNTLNPFINFKLNGHFENAESQYHNDIELFYGQDLRNAQNRVNLNQLLKYHKKSVEDFSVITKNKFEIHALPLKVEFDAEVDPKKVDIEAKGVYMDQNAELDLEGRTNIKKPGDYKVKVNAEVNKKGIELLAKRDIVSADKSNLENYIHLKGLGKYELSGVVLHKTKQNDMNVGAIGHLKISGSGKDEDIKFDVGVIENEKLYSSHAKIGCSKGDVLDYLLKVTRGANPSGQLKFVLKDAIAANGNFKVTDNDGKGNGMIIVDFKKSQRKIKGDVKFVVKDPTYNADVDIFLNFEKDNNDKVHFSTSNKRTEKLIDSKNKLEYGGQKTEVNVHREGTVGKSNSLVEVVLPTERCLSLKANHDYTVKNDVVNGHMEYLLSDATKRGGPASTISFKSKAVDTDYEKEKINLEGQIEIKLKDGKNLHNTFHIKNIPDNNGGSKFDFKGEVNGNLIPKPASISLTGSSIGYEKAVDDKIKLKGSYGTEYGFDVEDQTQVKYPAKDGEAKYQQDTTINVRLPFEKAHDIKLVSNLLFLTSNGDTGEFTIIESASLNGEQYKLDANGKGGPNEGFGKIKLLVPHADPFVLESSYKADVSSEKKKASMELKSQYGKGKSATIAVGAHAASQEYGVSIQADAPHSEKLKKLHLQVLTKTPAPDTYSASASLDADGRIYNYDALAVYSKSHPVIDLKYKCPESAQPSRILLKGNIIDAQQGKVEVKIENVRDINLEASSEAHIQKDNVVIKGVANAPQLGIKNYKVDISSKDAGSGKRLEFHATNDNKNVLSGSTSFISKQEGPKTIIEGSGSVKVKDEQKSANFKYIRTVLSEGNEQGIETFLNLAIGERSYVAESRVTNMEYKNSYVYCEEKKQCANVEVQSKINTPKPGTFQHLINVGFDLRKLGFAPEFGLQVSNEVSDKKFPQYTLDLHVNKADKKYYMHVYSQPEHGKFPSGIAITIPSRVLALESVVSYPAGKALPFPLRGEVVLHLDKNKPAQKTAARFLVDVNGNEQQHSGVAEFGFSHPKLGKEALLKINGKVQRPNDNTLKFETAAVLSHSSLGNDREGKIYFEVNPVHIKIMVNTPIVKVIDLEGNAIVKDNLQQGDLKFSLLEGKPVSVHAIAKDFEYYEFTTGYSDESERKLSIIGHIQPEKRVDISADVVLGKEKKNIIHGALFIQDNLVKSDYGVSKDNFKYFLGALQKDLDNLAQRIKQLGEKASAEFKNILGKVEQSLKRLGEGYRAELGFLFKDIADDETLREIQREFDKVISFLAKIIDDVVRTTQPLVEQICSTISETSKKVLEMYEKQIEPQIKELYGNVAAVVKEYLEGLVDLVAHFAALVADFYEKHKPELEELTNTVAEIFKDLTRLVVAQLKEIRVRLAMIFGELTQQIKEHPFINMIKEKFQDLAIVEQTLGVLQEVHNTIRNLLPTEETRNFADAVFNYVQKKIRQEKVDDIKELRVVYEKFAVALTSMIQFVRGQLNQFGIPNAININALPLLSGPSQLSGPALTGAASFSLISQILKGDVPDPLALIRAYRPRSLNPLDEIPAKLRAVVVNGQHIFTFDGRHLTFPGNCRYVLAHDHVDRNFTLVMQLQNGAPKALIIEDKSGTTIELKDNGQVLLNGATHGFPAHEKGVFGFKEANGRIGLGSSYGLMAFCTSKLEVCYIEVNGFYLGKLRGLLGDGNNEPYDDFRMVNGKISTSESEFANSYRLASSCPVVNTPEHSHHQMHATLPPACEQVFGATSTLRPISLLLDVQPFRQACIHAVNGQGDPLQQACDLARGYTALAVTGLLPAVLPPVCVQCTDTDAPKKVGDTYEFKLPNKQADIIVAYESTIPNEKNFKNLVVPLVSQLVDNLKAKHITDIKVYLYGVTPRMPYPLVHDTDIKLKNAKVHFTDESRYIDTPTIKTNIEYVDKAQGVIADVIDYVRFKTGLHNVVAGYQHLFELPLRPGAVKHAINVIGERCRPACFLIDIIRPLTYRMTFNQMAYTHSLVSVSPISEVGAGKQPSQVVGYTEDYVLFLGDKKPSKDSEALRQSLVTDKDDACVNFVANSGGMVLNAASFHGLNPGQQKQFLQTAATAITSTLLSENMEQECTCGYVDPFRVRSICYNKGKKEAARRRK